MKSQKGHVGKKGFTIIELLTVMSIIVILIGLLVPALNQVRRYALTVQQNAQFHAIKSALELYRNQYDQYPESGALDSTGVDYPGAMKLCEALMGQDLMGFHPESRFRADSASAPLGTPERLYRIPQTPRQPFLDNLKQRQGAYLEAEKVRAYRLQDIYSDTAISGSNLQNVSNMFVVTDVYKRAENRGVGGDNKIGMPVLYYKADVAGTEHDPNQAPSGAPDINGNNGFIYNYYDNQQILALNQPWDPAKGNSLDFDTFYSITENQQIRNASGVSRPYRSDSYILMSAGWDGEYGTRDDVTNFDQN